MSTEIKMPQLSDTMASGKIIRWLKKAGDAVARGDVLAEVETEKANLEIEAFQQGILLKIVAQAGTDAKVGETICLLGKQGEVVSEPQPINTAKPSDAPLQAQVPNLAELRKTPVASDVLSIVPHTTGRLRASPLARKIAQERNVDLSQLQGSGPDGRIVRKDVEAAASNAPKLTPSEPIRSEPFRASTGIGLAADDASFVSVSGGRLIPFSKMRSAIAKRMQESVQAAPHFFTTTSIDMSEAKKLREILKRRPEFKGLSINHLIIKASAYALAREPRVNRSVKEDQIFEPAGINVGIVTALDDGLLIPVVHAADRLSLKDLVFEARAVIERARASRPTSQDLSGATFSISNLGMFDVESFTAIISPGQGAILAVGALSEQPIIRQGLVVPSIVMKVTLSVDHRVIDGVMSGRFLGFLKEALETPALLLV